MKHIFQKENLGLVTIRRSRSNKEWNFVTSTKLMTTEPTTITSLDNNYFFPLYLYQENKLENKTEKVANFDMEIIEEIEKKLKMKLDEDFSPEDLFDYIYAVLHSKSYREKYKEFLKIDFPKIPFDCGKEIFFKMVEL
jgi:predicted helicase